MAFWREAKQSKKGKRVHARYVVANVVGPSNKGGVDDPNVWVSSSGHCISVSKEQLRVAYGSELWTPSEEDIREIKRIARKGRVETSFDETRPAGAESTEPTGGSSETPLPMSTYQAVLDEEEKDDDDEDDDEDREDSAEIAEARPTAVAEPENTERTAKRTSEPPGPSKSRRTSVPLKIPADAERKRIPESGTDTSTQAQKSARIFVADKCNNTVEISNSYLYANIPLDQLVREVCFTEHNPGEASFTMMRTEQKAFEKEIPWKAIPWDHRPLYAEALAREWTTWKRFAAVAILTLAQSAWIESNVDKSRILDTRACYKDRNASQRGTAIADSPEDVDAKTRIAALGYKDPDLLRLRRDAPTTTRVGLLMIFQISATFM